VKALSTTFVNADSRGTDDKANNNFEDVADRILIDPNVIGSGAESPESDPGKRQTSQVLHGEDGHKSGGAEKLIRGVDVG